MIVPGLIGCVVLLGVAATAVVIGRAFRREVRSRRERERRAALQGADLGVRP
ncbi:hypothetical protein ACIQUO_04485 [Streptomyces albogriseolus]|jgi:hypothetical protein|uniref:Histidine kinase n=2 Tax=Streptomyces albogriseolus group TaxID=2867120 RepID=A0ABP6TJB1_9ACTN|nr:MULTISPECIES: hypothetical protein [Streptomyces]GHC25864.1 hypothetical protein GCM10010332_66750 [Streptomyces albogriseolus]MCX4570403.1 hypothetical protein [Streptomyces viridodiastaticus]MCX4623725.1 hypothetical protein [Streptomyces viridodiastaticus]NIL49145.1 hypothetical protein [Streptomyces sp. 2BBP-J2]GHG30766.1 hypothetical protein GCM10018777_53000 [Streptomyces viridodiastaticus]